MMQYNKSSGFNSKEPITADQLNYLKILNYDGSTPKTRGEASDLISKLLAEKPKSETIRLGGSRLRLDKIPLVIYSDHWSEENPFAHIHEHSKDFYAAKEWRDSLDN